MNKSVYRKRLPQLDDQTFLTDGGLETSLVFLEDWELPEFSAFVLLDSPSGVATLANYYQRFVDIAIQHGTGFILESPTWRANPDWGKAIGYTEGELRSINVRAIEQLESIRAQIAHKHPIVISGCIGPQSDGYAPGEIMNFRRATEYHELQVETFAQTAADMVCAVTMTYVEEAVGIVLAAQRHGMPVAISFTVETDGRLPSGDTLEAAIETVDEVTNGYAAYYMVNCAHPTHFVSNLTDQGEWKQRIRGVRANASCMSHEELDNATELDAGNPEELGQQYVELKSLLPNLNVLGGCCGTDHRHVAAIADTITTKSEANPGSQPVELAS